MVIAERTTSYSFLAAYLVSNLVVLTQQGRTDLWPTDSILLPLKKIIQNYAKKSNFNTCMGTVMTISMKEANVDMTKVLVLPKELI
jgi:hypothetical protein